MRIPHLISVESSGIKEVGYNDRDSMLFVRFVTDRLYAYLGVSRATYEELLNAESIGRYFNGHVRNHYEHVDLSDD